MRRWYYPVAGILLGCSPVFGYYATLDSQVVFERSQCHNERLSNGQAQHPLTLAHYPASLMIRLKSRSAFGHSSAIISVVLFQPRAAIRFACRLPLVPLFGPRT
jgi:hypothetical protein